MSDDFRVWATCTDCGWEGRKVHLSDTRRWQRRLAVRLVGAMYWWHLLVGTRHTHWEWSR